jgi:poly-gamma-glutamate synthesis protein (capsule biosynthesis protein)
MRNISIALAVSLFILLAGTTHGVCPPQSSNSRVCPNTVDTLIVTFAGDLLLDRGVRREIARHSGPAPSPSAPAPVPDASPSGLDFLFTPAVDSIFQGSQIVIANLECPATKIKAPVFKRYIFRAEPEWLPALRRHGITHLCLANNHAIDQGREGLMDTRRNIVSAGMTPVGAGSNMAEAAVPVLLAHEPRNVWLLPSVRLMLENFAYLDDRPTVSQEPMDTLLVRVARLRKHDPQAVIIVMLHWGAEHTTAPVAAQRLDAHRLIDAGADALVCHHTHTLQTIEDYHGHPIYYSIGNFIFDQQKDINSRACLATITVTADTVTASTTPIYIKRCVPYVQ